ncbi:NEL-type E3 ubiquitin ligase domain-containing protein [Pseudomonas sp. NPDC089392]|uniref:NEL-type E3 ubiquitin ligase domain-containing protein n=1 Tax=Pseudomonas sp. NPDC089392 TaxID=3364459 RepID=UPI0037FF7D46
MSRAQHPHELLEQAAQDQIIARRLPDWLQSGSPEQLAVLRQALNGGLHCRYRIAELLAGIDSIEHFAAVALQQALRERFKVSQPLSQLWFRAASERPLSTYAPIRVPLSETVYYQTPLLEAALRNFTAIQAQANGQAPGNGVRHTNDSATGLPSAVQFARLVRELDLGQRYQRHLDEQLKAPYAQALLADGIRHGMLVDAFKARHQGVLSNAELELVMGLWRQGWLPPLNDARVVGKRLELLGCPLQQIVVFDVRDETFAPIYTSTRRVLVYVPGDPHGPWSAYDTLQQFARKVLGQRLRNVEYRQFFTRFIRHRDRQTFFTKVVAGYDDLPIWANIDLGEHTVPLGGYLFKDLAAMRAAQVKDDAAVVATPVARLDRELQQAHERHLATLGLSLLTAASLYMPALGVALLALSAWRWLGEVFLAIEAWQEGDTREALEHVTQVATDLAVIAATAAGATAVQRLWNRSVLVDGLQTAHLEDGSQRLWNGDLAAFRSTTPPAEAICDEAGVWRLDEQAWIAMEGHYYKVTQRAVDDHWQLQPRDGHGPLLIHNGAGAWRLWSEQPTQWRGSRYLCRRLGGQLAQLDDEQLDQLLAVHDVHEDHLRALHVLGRAAEPGLLDSARRALLERRVRVLVGQLRSEQTVEDSVALEQLRGLPGAQGLSERALAELGWKQRRLLQHRLYTWLEPRPDDAQAALQRAFPSLHGPAAKALLAQASVADRERLLATGRVPLRLAEHARRMLLPIRMARVYEALYWDTPQGLDLARVTLRMLGYLPAAPRGIRWRLFNEAVSDSPLLVMDTGAQVCDLVYQAGAFRRFDTQGRPAGNAGELFEVMGAAYDAELQTAYELGEPFTERLRRQVTLLAQARRQEVEQILSPVLPGTARLPARLADGRVGYPLSGRGPRHWLLGNRPGPFMRRVRYLYPSFTDEQVFAWIEQARASVIGLEATLRQYEQAYTALNTELRSWVYEGDTPEERENRRRLRRALRNCWQQLLAISENGEPLQGNHRWELAYTRTSTLPELSSQVQFELVNVLTLQNMQLEHVPDSFLRAFPNIFGLELPHNRLTRVPQLLLSMPNLRFLNLSNNHISLDSGQATILASCPGLVSINLSHNPLGRPFSLSGLPALRELRLADAGLRYLPYYLMQSPLLRTLDLRDNLLTGVAPRFYESRLWIEGDVQLQGNPFTAAEALRFQEALRSAVPTTEENATLRAARLHWMDAAGVELRTELGAHWLRLQSPPASAEFFHLLERLMETADFQSHTGARYLASRVLEMLRAMATSTELCESMFSNAARLTCQDSVALRFSDLELRMMVWRAETDATAGNQEPALLRLGRQLWRLDELDRVALQDIQARQLDGGDPDQVEVALAYRLALRNDLDLPVRTNGMAFRPVAGVDAARIAHARHLVLSSENGERLASSLIERDFWQTHLRSAHRESFDALDAPFHQRLEALQADSRAPEGERLVAINRVASQRRLAERELMHELTLNALDVHSELDVIYLR